MRPVQPEAIPEDDHPISQVVPCFFEDRAGHGIATGGRLVHDRSEGRDLSVPKAGSVQGVNRFAELAQPEPPEDGIDQ